MPDILKEPDNIESLQNGPFDYSDRGDPLELTKRHISDRLGGVLTDGIRPYSLDDSKRYPNVESLNTIVGRFDSGKIGLNSVPEGNEVKFRNAVLSEITPSHIGSLENMPVKDSGLDIEGHPDVSGVTVDEVNGIRGPQKYVSEVRFTRGYGVQTGEEPPSIEEGLLKSEAEVFLEICRLNSGANKLTEGGNLELDEIMTPRVIIITPNPEKQDDRLGIRNVMENTGMPPISYMKNNKIIS